MSFRYRLLPWPLLGLYDYGPAATFRCEVDAALQPAQDLSTVDIRYQLQSAEMQDLIDRRQAEYVAQFTCKGTGARVISRADHHDADIHQLTASEFPDEFLLTPYVVAVQDIKGFRCADMVPEIRQAYPAGFDVPKWGYLAVGRAHTLNPAPFIQAFSLAIGNRIPDGMYDFDLSKDAIQITVSESDYQTINRWRHGTTKASDRVRNSLFAALYQGALTHALQQLPEADSELGWVSVLRNELEELAQIEKLGQVPWDDMHNVAYEWAQRLLRKASETDYPLGLFLRAQDHQAEDDYGD